jgi:hypothetical protein
MAVHPLQIFLAMGLAVLPASAMAQSAQQRSTDQTINRNVDQALERAPRRAAPRPQQQAVPPPSVESQGGPRALSSHYEDRGVIRDRARSSKGDQRR